MYQEKYDLIQKLIPAHGHAQNHEVDLVRMGSNIYYDVHNNGGCNLNLPRFQIYIDTLEHVIARGKEAHVFWGESDDGPVAVKIFHTSNAVFKNLVQYIEGDPRFGGLKRKRRDLVTIWVRKEHRNAIRMRKAGVRVPKPLACHRNVLVMEHIGDPTSSAPRLQSVTVPNPPDILDELVESVSKIWHHAKLVHADLSPYNVLMHNGLPWIIDVGQSVSIRHPRAEEWLIRDVEKLVHWANKCGLVTSLEEILAHVLEGVGLKSGDSEE